MNDVDDASQNLPASFKENAIEYLRGMGMNLPQKYATQFINMCVAFKLNPFKRECYAVGYGDNWNIITGYEVYIKRAERTGKVDGWSCITLGSVQSGDLCAKLTINRKDWRFPFEHIVYYDEEVQKTRDGKPNAVWGRRPKFMLKKVCIAQGFRLCFPDELGGMPYTNDEISESENSEVEYEVRDENINQDALVKLLETYQDKLEGDPRKLIVEALDSHDEGRIAEMYSRTCDYLEKKLKRKVV